MFVSVSALLLSLPELVLHLFGVHGVPCGKTRVRGAKGRDKRRMAGGRHEGGRERNIMMQRWRGGGTLELARALAIGRSENHSFGNNRLHTLHTKDARELAKNCPARQTDRPTSTFSHNPSHLVATSTPFILNEQVKSYFSPVSRSRNNKMEKFVIPEENNWSSVDVLMIKYQLNESPRFVDH